MVQPSVLRKLLQRNPLRPLRLWPLLSLLIPLLPLLGTPVQRTQAVQQSLMLATTGEVLLSDPFVLKRTDFGATHLNVSVGLPINSALSLSIELLDSSNKVMLAFDKEGWREVGTWYEDGESGSYDESDNRFMVAFKPNDSGIYRLRFIVDGLEDSAGRPLSASLPLRVSVADQQFNNGLLFWTFLTSTALVLLFLNSMYCQGRRRYGGRVDDLLEASGLTRMNYEPGVLMLKLNGRYEVIDGIATSEYKQCSHRMTLQLELDVIDGCGSTVYSEKIKMPLVKRSASDEDDPPYWQLRQKRLYFRNMQMRSLRFRLSMPERIDVLEQEWLDIDLRDRVVTMRPLRIRRIS